MDPNDYADLMDPNDLPGPEELEDDDYEILDEDDLIFLT